MYMVKIYLGSRPLIITYFLLQLKVFTVRSKIVMWFTCLGCLCNLDVCDKQIVMTKASNYHLFSAPAKSVQCHLGQPLHSLLQKKNLYIPIFFLDDSRLHNKFSHISYIVDIWHALIAAVKECLLNQTSTNT